MPRRVLPLALLAVTATAASAWAWGGWAVITLDDLPSHLEAGKPTTFTFMIRQHGVTPIEGLSPTVEARTGSVLNPTVVRANAAPGKARGQYTASLVVPKAAEWRLTIRSSFGPSDLALLPIQATAPGATVAAVSAAERGQHLFVAKGCIMCHVRDGVEGKTMITEAPDLSGKQYDPAYLAMWLENPRIRPRSNQYVEMPNLGLSKPDIASLTAFINGGKSVASKKH